MKPSTQTFIYIGIAWVLLVCYSVLLTGAIEGVISFFNNNILDFSMIVPSNTYVRQVAIFLYGLAVVSFLGGSQIPAVFLRKKSFVIQFGFSAAFGFMLLMLSILNDTLLQSLSSSTMLFFSGCPVIALEYLTIPYVVMIFIDLHLDGRLNAFSWRYLKRYLSRMFLHPRQTFQEILSRRSILYSFVTVILVAVANIVRKIVVFQTDYSLRRWNLIPFIGISKMSDIDSLLNIALIVPASLLIWLLISALLHGISHQLEGRHGYSRWLSLVGFTFLPFLVTVAIDLLEIGLFQVQNSLVLDIIFLITGFFIPIIFWPLVLMTFIIQIVQKLSIRRTVLTIVMVSLPWFVLTVLLFL